MTSVLAMAAAGAQVRARVEWAGLPTGAAGLVALLASVAAVLTVAALYRRERAAGPARLRWLCGALRIFCLAALGVILLRPSMAKDVERLVPGRVVVLADRSASMSVRDADLPPDLAEGWQRALGLRAPADVAGLTRHDLLRGLLAREDLALVRKLARANQVDVITFADSARTVLQVPRHGPDAPSRLAAEPLMLPAWHPTGASTDLAGALRAALDLRGPGPLAAVVVLTDGRDTEGGDLGPVADLAVQRRVKLHFVGVGSPSMAKNVEVVEVFAADYAIRGLPFSLRAFVESQGYEGRSAALVLTATQPKTGETTEVARREIRLVSDGARQAVDLTDVPQVAGTVRYTATVEPMPEESRTDDNAAGREVLVTDQRMNVLLVSGGPSMEYRFLKAGIERAPAFALTAQLDGPPPQDLSTFDVVVLCDPMPSQVTADWLTQLAGLVDADGLGLAFIAGPAHSPELLTDPALGVLRDLLPVVADTARTRALVGAAGPFAEPRPVELTGAGIGHPVTSTGGEDAEFWDRVPAVYWALPAEREKAGAAVLLRCADPASAQGMPLAAVQPYGLGRVFYCGSPETWRWRQRGIEQYERFWLQALRYCAAGRLTGPGRRARISLERSVYALGEPVTVRVRLFDAALRPLEGERAELAVESSGVRVGAVELRGRPGEPGLYSGVFYPEQFGSFQLVYEAHDGVRVAESVQVRRPEVEFKDLRVAERTMRELAAKTGGRYLAPDEVGELPSLIPDLSRTAVESGPLEPLWDTPYLLAALTAALAVEWALRKRLGLL